jgi:hypothetical protein
MFTVTAAMTKTTTKTKTTTMMMLFIDLKGRALEEGTDV